MSNPVAVVISDVHYSLPTLELADAAMKMAINKANDLYVPLCVAGDLHDTKANLRGECVNRMIETFKLARMTPHVLRGNHDAINERSTEHSLGFLQDLAVVVDQPREFEICLYHDDYKIAMIPYQFDPEAVRSYLSKLPKNYIVIMHQGVQASNSGHYIHDKSALPKEVFADFRVISGHYHARQDIKCGRPQKGAVGLFSYIGNPYTLNFGEADDPEKGFQVLYDDGSLEFVPTNLRRHIKVDINLLTGECSPTIMDFREKDILWVRVQGTTEQLTKTTKKWLADRLQIVQDFRLDLTPVDINKKEIELINQTQPELLDNLIDSMSDLAKDAKDRLKSTWKLLLGANDANR